MDINYFMKVQNAYGTQNRREKELVKVNSQMTKHFEDTYDTEDVLLNGEPFKLMIIKDTDGNTFKKKIKSPHGRKFNLGDYVQWNDQVWLITLLDPDDKTWHRGYMYLCTVPLRWQNSDGKIVERFGYSEDFTKYSKGSIGNSTVTIGDNQYGLTLPIDSETKKLKRDMRFSIDFDDAETPDVYALTNRKVNLNNNGYFGRGGTMILTMSLGAFNTDKDKYITLPNGQEVWICDYIPASTSPSTPLPPSFPSDETTILNAIIIGSKNIKVGFSRTFTATLSDNNDNVFEWDDTLYVWNVVSDFGIKKNIVGNKIQLFIDNENFIGSSFLLQVIKLDDGTIIGENKITVMDVV